MVNDTTRLLGLDGLVCERVELDAAGTPEPGPSSAHLRQPTHSLR